MPKILNPNFICIRIFLKFPGFFQDIFIFSFFQDFSRLEIYFFVFKVFQVFRVRGTLSPGHYFCVYRDTFERYVVATV